MKLTENTPTKLDVIGGCTWMTKVVKIHGNIWTILLGTGYTYNVVVVRKVTNNPFGRMGTEFPSLDKAASHYKSTDMKLALVQAEIEFNQLIKSN